MPPSSAVLAEREAEMLAMNALLDEQMRAAELDADAALRPAPRPARRRAPSAAAAAPPPPQPSPRAASAPSVPLQPPSPLEDVGLLGDASIASLAAAATSPAPTPTSGTQATIRYQQARLKALERQLTEAVERQQDAEVAHAELAKTHKGVVEEHKKAARQLSGLASGLEKEKEARAAAADAAASAEQRRAAAEKELQQVGRASKATSADARARDVRLHRALEDVEKLKEQLAAERGKKRDEGAGNRQELDKLEAVNRRLKRQQQELISAFQKQIKLVDVLKKQKVHLEAAKMLSFSEDMFMQSLDWNVA